MKKRWVGGRGGEEDDGRKIKRADITGGKRGMKERRGREV